MTDHHAANLLAHGNNQLAEFSTVGNIRPSMLALVKPKPGTLTMMSAHPVAQGGTEAKIGAKKIDTMKRRPVTMLVSPVRPPSPIPAPLSMKAVQGDEPNKEPIDIKAASVQYASVDRGKSPSPGFTTPQKRTMEYSVAVASTMST